MQKPTRARYSIESDEIRVNDFTSITAIKNYLLEKQSKRYDIWNNRVVSVMNGNKLYCYFYILRGKLYRIAPSNDEDKDDE